MSYRSGDFVDCAFPVRERPEQPETLRLHVAYVEHVATTRDGLNSVALYTTSVPRPPDQPKRRGQIDIDERASRAMGLSKAFIIDAYRVLIVPITPLWFPHLTHVDHGIRGRAPEHLQQFITRTLERAIAQHEPLLDIYPRRPIRSK